MKNPGRIVTLFSVAAVVAALNWAAWLGWDQRYDLHPDGSVTGPYETWQIVGMALVLGAGVIVATFRRHQVVTVLGLTAGTGTAIIYDWSDDDSGLWLIGAGLAILGTALILSAVAAIAHALRHSPQSTGSII